MRKLIKAWALFGCWASAGMAQRVEAHQCAVFPDPVANQSAFSNIMFAASKKIKNPKASTPRIMSHGCADRTSDGGVRQRAARPSKRGLHSHLA
jgi:hypothetical protein